MDSWSDISFNVDLVNTAKKLLCFIKKIDRLANLYEGVHFYKALFRYEQIWLPILENNKENKHLVPPIDVEYIWYLHALLPTSYVDYGYAMNHLKISFLNIQTFEDSKEIWGKASDLYKYDYMKDEIRHEFFNSTIKSDFLSASLRQRRFAYQVSLNHFDNEEFLRRGVERYKKFLFLKLKFPNLILNPCNLINLIWRAHILNINEYKNDTEMIFGKLLPFDGTLIDRWLVDPMQKKIWKDNYNEEFFQPGAGFRGSKRSLSSRLCDPQTLTNVDFTLKVENIIIQCKSGKENFSSIFNIKLLNLNTTEEILSKNIQTNVPSGRKIRHESLLMGKSLGINDTFILTTVIKDSKRFCFSCPLLQKSEILLHRSNTEITIPKENNLIETQIHEFSFLDQKSTMEYSMVLELVISTYKRQATYFLNTNPFKLIDKNQCFELLNLLNEQIINSNDTYETILHASHQLVVKNQKTYYNIETIMTNKPFPFSGFKIQHLNSILSLSKTIDTEHIPSVGYPYPCLSLDCKSQRAMLVQNSNGDYAILKAEWIDDKNNGYLKIDWYSFEMNSITTYAFKDPLYFKFKNPENTVFTNIDLENGIIDISFNNNANKIESVLSCILSIVQLNIIVIPKYKNGLNVYKDAVLYSATGYHDFNWEYQPLVLELSNKSETLGVTFSNDDTENHSVIDLRSYNDENSALHSKNKYIWSCTII